MKDILAAALRWRAEGRQVVLARVVDVAGSAPREPGAALAVDDRGRVAGSVSGGCVEGAVVNEALALLEERAAGGDGADSDDRAPHRLVTFGFSDDDAVEVGLTCGGTIRLFLEPLDWSAMAPTLSKALHAALAAGRAAALATVIEGPGVGGKLLVVEGEAPRSAIADPDLARVVGRDTEAAMGAGITSVRHYGEHGEAREDAVSVFIEAFGPPPRMVLFGAVDFTAALARVAKVLGYHVVVCDAREVFATPARFPEADEVVVDWPQHYLAEHGHRLGGRDAVCVLTHDAKFDVPALVAALGTSAGYIGAMGSRRTTERRADRLRAEGVTEEQLARIMAPIGLDLGARTPEETAVSICAEIISCRTGRDALRLRDTTGPIHGRRDG